MISPRIAVPPIVIVATAYLLLVLIMWLPFNLCSGMPYETTFLYNSETLPFWDGFFYRADPLRIHTNTFYHLSYALGEISGMAGSFVPFQVVYAILWWARGLLGFLIARCLLPEYPVMSFSVGAFVILHASDGALQWVGQLNQFGFLFWMMLAFYLFLESLRRSKESTAWCFIGAATVCQYMSLWSYESQLFVILLAPACLLAIPHYRSVRYWRAMSAWYIVPVVYVALTVKRYMEARGQTYQESILRTDWSIASLASDLFFNMGASLQFWKWDDSVQSYLGDERLTALVLLAGALYGVGVWYLVIVTERKDVRTRMIPDAYVLWAALGAGLLFLAASFPAYLILSSARGLWRTQFLSGIGAALVLAAAIALVARAVEQRRKGALVMALLGAVVVSFGAHAALGKSRFHRFIWERHRVVMNELLEVAPTVRGDTLFILTNVSKDSDPFGHNMWFDFALRLAYPGREVAGVYFYEDHSGGPGNNMRLDGGKWVWDGTQMPPKVREIEAGNTLVIRYDAKGQGQLLKFPPPGIAALSTLQPAADLERTLIADTPSPRALRRYRPCTEWLFAGSR